MIGRFFHWFVSLFRGRPAPVYMGVSVFTGWASPRPDYGLVPGVQCPQQYPWVGIQKNRTPAMGQYDEAQSQVTTWRLSQMQRGKLDYCVYQHEWSPNLGKFTMNHCAENHPPQSPVQFAMSWWDVLSNSTDGETYWSDPRWTPDTVAGSLAAYSEACALIMERPNYLRIGGRPVLFRGGASSLRFYARFNLSPKQVLDLMGSRMAERPYFVAIGTDPFDHVLLKGWGFDAFTEYNLFAPDWDNAMATYRAYWAQAIATAKGTGIDYWVPASTGFDSTGWGMNGPVVFQPTPMQFTAHLKEARAFAQDNAKYTKGRVLTNNWSEFGEGSILEPMFQGMLHNGDEMLVAHARAVG